VYLGIYAALLTRFKPLELDPDMLDSVPGPARRFVRLRPPDGGGAAEPIAAEPATS
jgi:hypothetical protein